MRLSKNPNATSEGRGYSGPMKVRGPIDTTITLAGEGEPTGDEPEALELPEDLSTLSRADLDAAETQAVAAFNALRDAERTDENVAAMRAMFTTIGELRTELSARDAAAAEASAEVDEMAAGVNGELSDEGEGSDEEDADADAEGEGSDEGEGSGDEADDDADAGDGDAEGSAPAGDSVQASSRPRGTRRIPLPRNQPDPIGNEESTQGRATIVAAAEVPGLTAGQPIDVQQLATAFYARASRLDPKSRTRVEVPVGTIQLDFPAELTASGDNSAEVARVTEYACDETRLEGGSLTAAGGFCAPPEQFYDLCPGLEGNDGFWDVPGVNLRRGSASVFDGIDINDLYGQGFCFTVEQDEAGEYAPGAQPGDPNVVGDKPCIRVPCIDPRTVTTAACGLCIQTGILQMRAFPEVQRRFMEASLAAFARRVNNDKITQAEALATVVAFSNQPGATAHVLETIELYVEHLRHKYRTPRSATFEAAAPFWLRPVLRADLSKRLGIELLNVTDATINSHLASRGIRIQWLYDWQDAGFETDAAYGGEMGGATPPTQWPTNVKILVYPAGTFVNYTMPDITVNAIVDQALVRQNDEHLLFMEQFYKIDKRCYDAHVLDIGLCPDGSTQGGVDLICASPGAA